MLQRSPRALCVAAALLLAACAPTEERVGAADTAAPAAPPARRPHRTR
jgi:hypothetical protein